jgi:hypothetical protein
VRTDSVDAPLGNCHCGGDTAEQHFLHLHFLLFLSGHGILPRLGLVQGWLSVSGRGLDEFLTPPPRNPPRVGRLPDDLAHRQLLLAGTSCLALC